MNHHSPSPLTSFCRDIRKDYCMEIQAKIVVDNHASSNYQHKPPKRRLVAKISPSQWTSLSPSRWQTDTGGAGITPDDTTISIDSSLLDTLPKQPKRKGSIDRSDSDPDFPESQQAAAQVAHPAASAAAAAAASAAAAAAA